MEPKLTVLKIFDNHIGFKANRKTSKSVERYIHEFENKNEQHIHFLSGNLVGVYDFRFTKSDENTWLDEVLNVHEYGEISGDFLKLDTIDTNWYIGGNPFNYTFLYVAHKALTTKELSKKEQEQVAMHALNMVQYKFLSSIYNKFFPYKVNEALAVAIYESLSLKFSLKKYGSWKNVITHRSSDIIQHPRDRKTLVEFEDIELLKLINDIHGRLKSIMIRLFSVLRELKDMDTKITSSGAFVLTDEGEFLKDVESTYVELKNNAPMLIADKHSFIRQDLIEVVARLTAVESTKKLYRLLDYIHEEVKKQPPDQKILDFVNDIIKYTIDIIETKKLNMSNIPSLIISLRGMLKASRVTSELNIRIKAISEELVIDVLKLRYKGLISSLKIALIIYISIRIVLLTKK